MDPVNSNTAGSRSWAELGGAATLREQRWSRQIATALMALRARISCQLRRLVYRLPLKFGLIKGW